ncbi:Mitochondrial transcription termination factor family protein [Thalictrum thalictroides]|uniref:Mitochondrial transcription termination factor family protein n=1 Tax=Thalictrum thalictroides TaxID=46969 RepID=A0A7J6VM17_THATH|nr:Mitochondrial transcription termination factor family protein [Thalictrum thalictroides]
MLNLICRKLLFQANTCRIATTHLSLVQINGNQDTLFNFIQNPNFKSISSSTNDESSSFTVSYLIESCGISPESAVKVAKKVNLKTTDTPDLVLELLVNHGFTKPQITHLITKHPSILLSSIKVLDPKLQFLKKVGLSETDIPKVITSHASIFIFTSLQDRIIPSYNFLRTLYTHDEILSYFQRRTLSVGILEVDLEKHLPPKLKILKDRQVPDFVISTLIFLGRRVVSTDIDIFNEAVNEVIELGVGRFSKMFAYGVCAYQGMTKAKRVAKLEIYKTFGWSDDEIRLAIKNQPTCISISEDKLRFGLDFFMNKMNWEPQRLAKAPNILGLSLEKRVFPRLKVIEFLISNGLLPSSTCIVRLLFVTDANFIDIFLTKSKNRAPEVMKLYQASKQRFPWASSELK